ncbi:hypothetical protein [Variovorax sp. LT1R16]|uniref:hypothetical protein n=1 Tax=Variovorax sp. LT1R16 TaxID=3443728 RepID=UPI003F4657CF
MKSYNLEIFADYFQFYLQDEAADGNLGDAWDQIATERMFAVADGTVGIGTVRNMDVPVTLELLEVAPSRDFTTFDHVVEGSVLVSTGTLVVAGCTAYFPDARRFPLEPGTYRVRLSSSGLGTLSTDGLEGKDHYLVQLWLDSFVEPTVLKQHSP